MMNIIVTYHVRDAEYKGGEEMEAFDSDVGILTATSDLATAFRKMDEHFTELGDEDVDYILQFYRDGDLFTEAMVAGGYDAGYDEVKEFLKEFYH